ncbi:1116_t:CDS:2, partial [Racocetra fulgida]
GLEIFDRNQEPSVQIVHNEDEPSSTGTFQVLQRIRGQEINVRNAVKLDSKKVVYGRGLGLCKKALNIAITNGSNKVLKDFLQRFIDEQVLLQSKGRPANKRYLTATEDYNSKNIRSSNQDESGQKKKNKRQCAICKSWYHDSRNCPEK